MCGKNDGGGDSSYVFGSVANPPPPAPPAPQHRGEGALYGKTREVLWRWRRDLLASQLMDHKLMQAQCPAHAGDTSIAFFRP